LRPFSLQLFAEERSEPATPRKRRKAREEGKVARSMDLTAAVASASVVLGGYLLLPLVLESLSSLFRFALAAMGKGQRALELDLAHALLSSAWAFLRSSLPLMLLGAFFSASVLVLQVGLHLTFKPLSPDLSRLDPVSGLRRIFSLRSLVELIKGVLKASLLLLVLYLNLRADLPALSSTLRMGLSAGLSLVGSSSFRVLVQLALVFLLLGFADYLYQRWEFERSLRMSKQELKEEFKQIEGDPLVKRRIRQRQRELARSRMMAQVPRSDVVITNPTSIAVALRYDPKVAPAPVVVAKGMGFLAQRIREIAEESGVPIVQDVPLARALYASAEVGEEIPPELYRAVAEVLAFVYSGRGRSVL